MGDNEPVLLGRNAVLIFDSFGKIQDLLERSVRLDERVSCRVPFKETNTLTYDPHTNVAITTALYTQACETASGH